MTAAVLMLFIYFFLSPTDYSLFGGADSLTEGKPHQRAPRRVFTVNETGKKDVHDHSAPPQDPSDFLWLMTEEPHRTRRMQIMKAHPEVSSWKISLIVFQSLTFYARVHRLQN